MSELFVSDLSSYDDESYPSFLVIEEDPEIVLNVRHAVWRAIEEGDYAVPLIMQDTVDKTALDAYWRAIRPSEFEYPTPMDMMAYSLTRSSTEVEAAVNFLWSINRGAVQRGIALRSADNGWRMDGAQAMDDDRWERSALELAAMPYDGRELGSSYEHMRISSQAMVSSIKDGKIAEIFYDRPEIMAFLRDYCRDVLGHDMQDPDVASRIEQVVDCSSDYTPDGVRYVDFFESALRETAQKPYAGKHIKGALYGLFAEQLKLLNTRLEAISPDLEAAHLHAISYQPPAIQDSMTRLDVDEHRLLAKLYKEKDTYFSPIGEQAFHMNRDVVLAPGLLAKPPYIRSADPRSCVSTCFRMVFAGVTGSLVNGHELQDPLVRAHGAKIVDQEVLLKLYESEAFRRSYGQDVKTIAFTGIDLRAIRNICTALATKNQNYRTHFVANIRSRNTFDRNIWHAVVVTGVDRDKVTFHDPSDDMTNRGPDSSMSKEEFMKRWASTYNTGYLTVDVPKGAA